MNTKKLTERNGKNERPENQEAVVMAQKIDRGNRRKRQIYVWFLLAGAITISGMFAGGLAKYAHQESKEEKSDSQRFYFTSDYLTEEGTAYTLSADTKDLCIELRNYEDALCWSDSDISYKYTVTKDGLDVTNSLSGSNPNTIEKKNDAGNASEITLDSLSAGTYYVTVETTSPYKKILKGTFTILSETNDISYNVSDNEGSPYALLTVSTDAYEGKVIIKWPNGLIPDSTQEEFEDVHTWSGDSNTGTYSNGNVMVAVTKNSSYTYRFFKTNTAEKYTKNDITAAKAQ